MNLFTNNDRIFHEKTLWDKGYIHIAGVDEVGRGCLAGPMVVGAVILNLKHFTNNDVSDDIVLNYNEIKDSKKLSSKKRQVLSDFIINNAVTYSIEVIDNTRIDEWGISKSTQIGFFNAIQKLNRKAQYVLTDSFQINALPEKTQTNIVRGDDLSITIAAASIVAKVYRDALMTKLHTEHEEYKPYCFEKNKGYGTKLHIQSIRSYGITSVHRRSFEPVKSLVESQCLSLDSHN